MLAQLTLMAQTGIYGGSGTIPNNTKARITDNFYLGSLDSINIELGTYMFQSKINQRLHLISQGYVRLGDPNNQGQFPVWMEMNSQAGYLQAKAKKLIILESDTFMFQLDRGGLQLPDNVFSNPFLLQGDRGTIFFNSTTLRPVVWDGFRHRPLAFTDESKRDYVVVTTDSPIGAESVGIIYAEPSSGNITITLPPKSFFDGRELVVKHIGTSQNVSIVATATETINGGFAPIVLIPGAGMKLHAMQSGWQTLGGF
jgi:hypothetical protein